MNWNGEIYDRTWQELNRSKIFDSQLNSISSVPLNIFDRLNSTNTKLWELIEEKINLPVSAIALEQSAGKGQWGKEWVSASGGLYLSIGLDINLDLKHNHHLVMATAWGIAKVLRHYSLPVTIKWLNDLILEESKLGGIKIETRNISNKIVKAVIGVGINYNNPVPVPGINLQSYYKNNSSIKINCLEKLAAITSYGIIAGYQYYLAVGIEQLLTEYIAICSSMGKQIIFNNCPGEVIGITTEGKIKIKLRSPGATTNLTLSPGEISLGY